MSSPTKSTVRGTVHGSVRGNRVLLQSTSKVEGDVFHQQLGIEQGAFFEGKSRRVENPTAGVQRPEITLPPDGHYANGARLGSSDNAGSPPNPGRRPRPARRP